MNEREILLVRIKQVEVNGMFKHRDTGLMPRTFGIEPEQAMELVDKYTASKVREALERIDKINEEGYGPYEMDNSYCAVKEEIAAMRAELEGAG